jgi:hypothetical protein
MIVRFLSLCILFSACGGSLTDEQRKKAKADIERNQIKKISDAQITDAAFSYGRFVAGFLTGKEGEIKSGFGDSLANLFHVKIVALRPGDSHLSETEKRLVEAYAAITSDADFTDNIQKIDADSILYTKPIVNVNSGKSLSLDYALGIRMPKKEIVLTIKD